MPPHAKPVKKLKDVLFLNIFIYKQNCKNNNLNFQPYRTTSNSGVMVPSAYLPTHMILSRSHQLVSVILFSPYTRSYSSLVTVLLIK